MRICLISREYPPDTGFGGIATFTRHLVHGFVALGHEVEVVSLAKDGAPPSLQNDEGVPVHRVVPAAIGANLGWTSKCMPYSRYVLRTSAALWVKFEELNRERPFDVVDTPELLAEGFYPAITRSVPLLIRLYTPHSKFIAERLHNVTDTFDHQFVAMVERVAMLSADILTSPSEDLADFVASDLNVPKSSIRIVRNPIDSSEFSPDGPRAELPAGTVNVLFVGRLEGRKGIHHLIDAVPLVMKEAPNVRFTVVGDDTNHGAGQKSVKKELIEKLRQSGSERCVNWIPRIALSELPAYYRAADISVVPSLYDNSPYTSLEAMACGTPVVGTDGGGTKEYVLDGQTGVIVKAGNAETLARAIIDLAGNPGRRQELGLNARRRAVEVFDRKQIARETAELYREAIEKHKSDGGARLYPRDAGSVLIDADEILYTFDIMIRELVLAHSIRARIKFWFELATRRPRLFAAKVAVGCAKIFSVSPRKPTPDSLIARWECEIARKERPPLAGIANTRYVP